MVSATKKAEAEELRKIKQQAKASKAEAKIAAAKKRAKLEKRGETQALRAANLRGSKGVLVSASDIKDPELRSAEGARTTPPHRYEVHVKKQLITVTVTLHRVPPSLIDVEATTDSRLVVSTPKFTRKLHLDFPFPDGMLVDAAKGDYTFEAGELRCVFPVTKMPLEVMRAWNDRLESVRKSQRARFDYDKDGDLVVRRRKTTLELADVKAQAKAKKEAKAKQAAPSAAAGKKASCEKSGAKEKAATTAVPVVKPAAEGKPGAASNKSTPPTAQPKKKPGTGSKDDKAAMLKAAADAARQVTTTLAKRLETARAAHERRLQKSDMVRAAKSVKNDKMASAFERIVEDKRRELERSVIKPAPQRPSGTTPGKKVRFSA